MNLVYIDFDAIFWKAFNNIRLINIERLIKNIFDKVSPDKIYACADFTTKKYFENVYKELTRLSEKYPIEILNGYNKGEEKNLTDIVLINYIYQSFIQQESIDQNTYTIVTADTKYFNTMSFIQNISNKKVNLIVANDVPYCEHLNESFRVVDYIDIKASERNIFDKTVIKEILNIVKWGEDNNHWLTIKNIVDKCDKMSNINPNDSMFILHALISFKFVEKQIFINEAENIEYKICRLGDREKLNKFLLSMNIEL